MFETIRAHIPAARTLTDDRLTAIVAATGVLLLVAMAMDVSAGTILLGVAVAVLVARRIGGRRSAHPAILVRPAVEEDEVPMAPSVRDGGALDPLLARAMALRERTLSRT